MAAEVCSETVDWLPIWFSWIVFFVGVVLKLIEVLGLTALKA